MVVAAAVVVKVDTALIETVLKKTFLNPYFRLFRIGWTIASLAVIDF